MADVKTAASRIAKSQYNSRNAGVKRILQEAREIAGEDSAELHAAPVEDNLFEWHFTIRGPEDSDFAGGIYHGRLMLPTEYPMRPPNIILLTPNGRFELNKKICLTITGYHEELWQPAWGIRTALMALVSFFTTEAQGQVGGIDSSSVDRKHYAALSSNWKCPHCGAANKDLLPPRPIDSKSAEPSSDSSSSTVKLVAASSVVAENVSAPPTSPSSPIPHILAPAHSPAAEPPLSAVELGGRPGPRPQARPHVRAHGHGPVHAHAPGANAGAVGMQVERALDAFEEQDPGQDEEPEHDVGVHEMAEDTDEDRMIREQVAQVVAAPKTTKIDALIAVLVFFIASLVVRKLTPAELRFEL